ncbi:MAG: MarR family transcriptional regulator [Chloroflexi bacterium]|jgi:predicted ArsR family transcriptional regulator|nr:MarR family transcriptional regulator [Chloroflexota bacterium]
MSTDPSAQMADVQSRILAILKQRGEATTQEIAAQLDVTYEAVRQQVKQLEANGLVGRRPEPNPAGVGRPLRYYSLTPAGEHYFPKQYDDLAVSLIDAVGESLGRDALQQVLAALADDEVAAWEQRLAGLSLEARLEALRDYYIDGDPFMTAVGDEESLALVERNCPYLNVALRRPALCSLTVSVLSRLLGYRVTRVRRFQDGDGRCVFRVHLDRPLAPDQLRFEFEGDQH